MSNNNTAFWSAIAASCSALASLLIVWVQRQNLLESVRPELVLTRWDRQPRGEGRAAHEVISFHQIQNVGRGVALNVHLQCAHTALDNPTATLSTLRAPIIAAAQVVSVNGDIVVWWKNVPERRGYKYLAITVTISYWDTRNMRYDTDYVLFALESGPERQWITDEIAPLVGLTIRRTIRRPLWWLKLIAKLRRIPGLRRA